MKRKNFKKIPQDIVGNIAILKFKRTTPWLIKKFKAYQFLKSHKNLTTVVEKVEGFSGELRIPTTKYLAGEKTYNATHKENNCIFQFNINESYFSPRLSNERKVIAEEVAKILQGTNRTTSEANYKRSELQAKRTNKMYNILVMFAGIGPYPIVIAKTLLKNKKSFHIYANELNKDAVKEMQKNICLNKLQKHVTVLPGDANKIPAKQKFDLILMPRPNLKDTFLKHALKLSKSETTIFYHGFGTKEKVLEEIKKDCKNKIGKISIRKAGDIAYQEYRWQATFKVK